MRFSNLTTALGGGIVKLCTVYIIRKDDIMKKMHPKRYPIGFLTGIMLLIMLSGCATSRDAYFRNAVTRANVYVDSTRNEKIQEIALLPLKAETELIGTSVADLFVTEFLRTGRYTLVERSQISHVLGETELALSGLSADQAIKVGTMVGADGVIIGTVSEYGTMALSGHAYPVVAISLRLIDCTSSKIVWSVDLAARADSKKIALSEQARKIVHEIVAGLYQQWLRQPSSIESW